MLAALADHGVVLVEERGSGRLCRLNRAHLAVDALVAVVGLRGRMFDLLRHEIRSWGLRPVHASVFGSAARGDGHTRSDLDLLVVRPDADGAHDDEAWEEQLSGSGERIWSATANRAAWFLTTPAGLRRAVAVGEPIVGEWRRDAVHLTGRRFGALLRKAA